MKKHKKKIIVLVIITMSIIVSIVTIKFLKKENIEISSQVSKIEKMQVERIDINRMIGISIYDERDKARIEIYTKEADEYINEKKVKYIAEIEDIKLENITEQKIVDEIEYLNQNSRNVAIRVREKGMYEIRVRCRIRCFTLNDDGKWIGENVYEDMYREEFFIQRLDTTPPSNTILSASNTEWTNQDVILTGQAKDNIGNDSGLFHYQFSTDPNINLKSEGWKYVDGSDESNVHGTEKETTKQELVNESGTYYFYAKDVAENISKSNPVTVKMDKTLPQINNITGNPTEWTKENVTLTVNAEDAESGLGNQAYSFDGGTTWQESNKKTYTENTNGIIIKVKDNVGNISISEPINITKIRRLQSITIKTQPNKTKYILNEDLDTTGLVIYLNYDNGDKEEINQNFTCTPTKLTQVGTQKITVTYEDKSVNFYVEVKEEPSKPVEIIVESEKYKIEKEIIKNIQPKTQLLEFKRNIKTNSKTIKVLKDTNEITNTEKLATGMKMLLDNNIYYKIIVKGDCNGDGQANLQDILLINKHRLNKTQLKNEYLTAGDTDEDGKVEIKDILKLNKYRLNKIEEI